jgi:hypothetical protein
MDRTQIIQGMIAQYELVTGVLECIPETGCPESTIYIGLGSNYELSVKVLNVLKKNEAITVKGNYIRRAPNYEKCITNGKSAVNILKGKLTEEQGAK